jgi:2-polyprenyl-3-methyl-5-hydroxy-6-metoxy-1,4-benzoquinol methylase
MFKEIVKKSLKFIGIKVTRIGFKGNPADKYFNSGKLSSIEENSSELYDKFYSDHKVLDKYYDKDRLEFYKNVAGNLQKEGVSLKNKTVLDMGTGVGYLLDEIVKIFDPISLTGADYSVEGINYSKVKFPNINFFVHDVNDPLPEEYDVIFCTEVLEHILDPYTALENLVNGLNSGGILVLTVPDGRKDTIHEHINFWSPESWGSFLTKMVPDANVKNLYINEGSYNYSIIKI